ncbi:hypothetical protein ANRL1_02864 [Anaerolineae bacterium]|nr:hypothetical protein ANRL1_02864 [Anaerolineae bacterium]
MKESKQSNVIALDPGFGNTKVCFAGNAQMLQTAVSRPRAIGMAAIGMRSAARHVPIVEFAGRQFAVGVGSWNKGTPLTSMDYSSLVSPERIAIFYAALANANHPSTEIVRDATLIVGLPVPLLAESDQASRVKESLRALKGEHTFTVNGASYTFSIARIKVLAQPVGGYYDWLYDDQLKVRAGASVKTEAAIIDLGMNTLDIYVIESGQVVETFIGGAEVGVRRLLEMVASNGHDLVELDAQLRSGALRPSSDQLEAWLSEVNAAIKRVLPMLKRFGVVIPVGGGVTVLGGRLRGSLASKGAVVHWSDEPIAANVRGLWKFGEKYA